ncbi:hypothetical protein SUGI_0029950 [Cryptomeria japonica]|uniref:protein RST1 isoform X1 n=1 Tax=Cryptomeria japonica TaxID=3369 RepID=UPI0024089854|nr:protein RST1 isoform X1 [Cryptomeria japonica]GLJ05985.1 hypothetical protein SUGI_0029950 [Cryptomeria japonica]
MGEGSSYESMMEKLKSGQAGMQRFAVIGIAEKVRRGEAGREALFLCLRYSEAPVIDQTVRELICLAAEEKGKVEFPEVFRELQAALEGSPSHSIETITKAIGYLSRLLFKRSSPHISTIFSPHNNPFIKVFASRVEAHTELLQQVILFVAEVTFTSYADFALFLSPLLTYTAMQISTSTRHTFFFQSLHSHLASLSCTHLSQGLSIFRILVECIQYYPRESTEEIWVTTALAEELVDALKIIMNKSTGKAMEERLCGLELSKYLVSLCNDLSNRGLGSSSVLVLLKHSVEVQMDKDHEYFCDFDSMLITLAHMLATMQYEHEQLLLLNLAIVSLEWKQESGLQLFQNTVADFPVEVLFIFPVIHVMSSPSKTIKKTAISLLQVLQKKLHELLLNPSLITISESTLSDGEKFGMFVHRLVKHIWSQDQGLITWNCDSGLANIWLSKLLGSNNRAKVWLENIQLTFLKGGGGSKRILSSQEKPSKDVVLLLSMVLSGLVLHPKLGSCAIEALTALSRIEQSVGVSYLLVVLFYLNFLHKYGCKSQALVLELLGMLPDLACHSVTVPLILQTVQQMLNEDSPMELRATALRLLCKTWEFSDHVFVHLQKFLHPKLLSSSTLDMDLVISMAACVRDVCKKDPDRGVDLILSVQACIESKKAAVQALGLESLAHLCEFDVVDFYTAWAFISKFLEDPLSDPVVSYSLCVLLRWGAVDAAAYPEASKRVFEILWEVSTVKGMEFSDLWVEARISAIHALTFFEVEYFQQKISEFPGKHVDLLISEHSSKVQNATEGLVIKFLMHEHSTRRKVLRQERVGMNKVEKLLHALPNIIFSPDGKKSVADIPGASLLCLTFSPPPKALAKKVYLKDLQKWQAKYKDALMENAEGIQLSRNIFLALLSLQSWLSFMRCWLRAKIMVFEAEGVCDGLEQITLKAAKSILQDIRSIAEEVVPSTAENLALAIGALCMVLPSSVHNLAPDASEFLLHWLGQDAHEYKQWTSAISLGLLSTCLHITDWKNRYEIIFSLLKVAGRSDRSLVVGGCGVGLGFACQGLLHGDSVGAGKQEEELLGLVVKSLTQLLCQICPSAMKSLQSLYEFDLFKTANSNYGLNLMDYTAKQWDNSDENVWGIAGLVIGLGISVAAIQKHDSPTMVIKITNILMSWIPSLRSGQRQNLLSESFAYNDVSAVSLAVGSCLALSTAVSVCHKLELMDEELDSLVDGFRILISESASQKEHGYLYQNLLMASCIGSGNLLSCILKESAHPMRLENIKHLLETIRRTYIEPNPPVVHFGGMMGLVNALSAGAGLIDPFNKVVADLQPRATQKETSFVRGPILSNPHCEVFSLSLIQEILGVVRDSNDIHLRHSAGWALSFLRNAYFSSDHSLHQETNVTHIDFSSNSSSISSQSFPEDSTVWRLCSVLLNYTTSQTGSIVPVNTIVSVLRCLEKAPRLPSLDWGGLVRCLMRYKDQISANQLSLVPDKHSLHTSGVREECVHFSFVHADHISSLLNFLNELCEISRLKLLEHSLQCVLLLHMVDMIRIFSQTRMQKFFSGIMDFFGRQLNFEVIDHDTEINSRLKTSLKITFWKSLHKCLTDLSLPSLEIYSQSIKNCMQSLFQLLPSLPSNFSEMRNTILLNAEEEWSQAIKCLMDAPKEWLLDILQIEVKDSEEREKYPVAMKKVIFAKARLVANNGMSHSELGKVRSYLLNEKSSDNWRLLMEVAMALRHTTNDVKRKWLLDTIETSCVSKYPSTALRFIGLLTSSWCPYASCLTLDPNSVLQDLPFTCSSLFVDGSWSPLLGTFINKWLNLIERLQNWQSSLDVTAVESIEKDEKQVSSILLEISKQTCIALKDRLPFEVQFKLANITVSES